MHVDSIAQENVIMAQSARSDPDNSPSSTPSSGRKLKRYKSVGTTPDVGLRLCVGKTPVATELLDIGDKVVRVTELNPKKSQWLSLAFGWAVLPSTCVLAELMSAVRKARSVRKKALWKGSSMLLSVDIRGRQVQCVNDLKSIKVVLDEDNEFLQWFVNEMYFDLKKVNDPQDKLADASNSDDAGERENIKENSKSDIAEEGNDLDDECHDPDDEEMGAEQARVHREA